MPANPTAHQQLADHLAVALDAVLAGSVLVGGIGDDIPDAALDSALAADKGVQGARESLQEALNGVRELGVGVDAYLALEATCNALCARCAEAGFRLGLHVGRGLR